MAESTGIEPHRNVDIDAGYYERATRGYESIYGIKSGTLAISNKGKGLMECCSPYRDILILFPQILKSNNNYMKTWFEKYMKEKAPF